MPLNAAWLWAGCIPPEAVDLYLPAPPYFPAHRNPHKIASYPAPRSAAEALFGATGTFNPSSLGGATPDIHARDGF